MEPDSAPYTVQLDQADAVELARSGAILLILNVPPGTLFGLNRKMFIVGINFKGVKMLLPGPHFVYYSAVSRHGGDSSPVTGFFIHAAPSQVIVRQWDTQEERLAKMQDSSEEERFEIAARNMEFDRQLAPYDLDDHKRWQLLTNFISPNVIDRIEPVGGDISVMSEAALVSNIAKTSAERRMYEQITKGREWLLERISSISVEKEGHHIEGHEVTSPEQSEHGELQSSRSSNHRCFFTRVPHFAKQSGMTASELTSLNMDRTQTLETLIENEYNGKEELLLGELQFSFIAFLMGQSLESFGQWKEITSLLLRCEDAPLRTRTKLFSKFLGVIYWQLRQSLNPDAKANNEPTNAGPLLDDSWFGEDNFFRLLLKDFLDMLREASPVDGEILRQGKRLKKLVEETMGWIFDVDNVGVGEEDDEYAPTVVYEEDAVTTGGDATQ